MRRYWEYAKYVLRHKWYVFKAGRVLGIPLLAALHDNSKFLLSEFIPYARFFYAPDGTPNQRREKSGYYKPYDTGKDDFDQALLFHLRRNRHHWQYWALPRDDGGMKVFPMPERYVREMLADWWGAGAAQGNTNGPWGWYDVNKDKLVLHDDTRRWIESVLNTWRNAGRPVPVPSSVELQAAERVANI